LIVAGLDTASNRCHLYVHGWSQPWWTRVFIGMKEVPNPDARRHTLYREAKAAFALLPAGAHIFCEEPLALKNGRTTRMLGLAAGAIWAAHLDCDLFWHWVDVSHWKKAIVGNGNADKQQVRDWVQQNLGEHWEQPEDADFYDAACLCAYGESVLGK